MTIEDLHRRMAETPRESPLDLTAEEYDRVFVWAFPKDSPQQVTSFYVPFIDRQGLGRALVRRGS